MLGQTKATVEGAWIFRLWKQFGSPPEGIVIDGFRYNAQRCKAYQPPPILVYESEDVPGAYLCDHVPCVNGSTEPGDDVVCMDCCELLDAGAEIQRVQMPFEANG